MSHQPITNRFAVYSDQDRRADELWDFFRSGFPFEVHGGAFLHEQAPHIQHLVYGYAETKKNLQRMIEITPGPPIVVEKGSNLAEILERDRVRKVLDDWVASENYVRFGTNYDGQGLCVLVRGLKGDRLFYGATLDAARKAAADAIEKGRP